MRSVWRRGLIRRISLATPDALCIWLASEKGARHCCTRNGLSGKWRVQKEKGFPNKAAASTTHPCKKNRVRLSRDYARWGGQENENKRSQFKTRLNSNLSNKNNRWGHKCIIISICDPLKHKMDYSLLIMHQYVWENLSEWIGLRQL